MQRIRFLGPDSAARTTFATDVQSKVPIMRKYWTPVVFSALSSGAGLLVAALDNDFFGAALGVLLTVPLSGILIAMSLVAADVLTSKWRSETFDLRSWKIPSLTIILLFSVAVFVSYGPVYALATGFLVRSGTVSDAGAATVIADPLGVLALTLFLASALVAAYRLRWKRFHFVLALAMLAAAVIGELMARKAPALGVLDRDSLMLVVAAPCWGLIAGLWSLWGPPKPSST